MTGDREVEAMFPGAASARDTTDAALRHLRSVLPADRIAAWRIHDAVDALAEALAVERLEAAVERDSLRSALEAAEDFLESVTAWNGGLPDDLDEILYEVRRAIASTDGAA